MVAVTGTVQTSGNGGSPTGHRRRDGHHQPGRRTSTTTGSDGSFTLMAAAGSTLFVKSSLTGYESSEYGFVVPASGSAESRRCRC